MNLRDFNNGSPNTKFWLNPVFGNVNCKNILLTTSNGEIDMTPPNIGFSGQALLSNGDGTVDWGSNEGNPFDQSLNTTDDVVFQSVTSTLRTNDAGIVLGQNAGGVTVPGINSIIIGSNAGTDQTIEGTICIGMFSQSTGQDSVAIGFGSSATAGSSIAIGNGSSSTGLGSVSLGTASLCSAESVAIGRAAQALNDSAIIINASGEIPLQSTANNQIKMKAGTTEFTYDSTGFNIPSDLNVTGLINGVTVGGGFFAAITSSTPVVNTLVETSLTNSVTGVGSLTVPANTFPVGGSYICELGGTINCLNNSVLDIKIYGGPTGNVLLSDLPNISISTTTNRWWGISLYLTIRAIGGPGVASISARSVYQQNVDTGSGNLLGQSFAVVNNTTFATNVDNRLNITAQWTVASPSNSIVMSQCVLTKSY